MPNSYKDIIITPSRGSTTVDPRIEFRGANTSVNTAITVQTYPTSNGTLSFEGSAGQLFSITNDLTGSIFSVNDVSGIPSIEVYDTGNVRIAEYGGNVSIGTSNSSYRLYANGTSFFNGGITYEGIAFKDAVVTTTAAITQFALASFPIADYDSGEILIQAASAGAFHVTKLLFTSNTTTSIATEYGTLLTGSSLFTVDTDVSAGNVRILITPASTTSTTFKATYELLTA
jgi:hypothetical protein